MSMLTRTNQKNGRLWRELRLCRRSRPSHPDRHGGHGLAIRQRGPARRPGQGARHQRRVGRGGRPAVRRGPGRGPQARAVPRLQQRRGPAARPRRLRRDGPGPADLRLRAPQPGRLRRPGHRQRQRRAGHVAHGPVAQPRRVRSRRGLGAPAERRRAAQRRGHGRRRHAPGAARLPRAALAHGQRVVARPQGVRARGDGRHGRRDVRRRRVRRRRLVLPGRRAALDPGLRRGRRVPARLRRRRLQRGRHLPGVRDVPADACERLVQELQDGPERV